MKKCVANFQNGYTNIKADRLEREDGVIFVFDGDKLVGMFDIGILLSIWLSEVKE